MSSQTAQAMATSAAAVIPPSSAFMKFSQKVWESLQSTTVHLLRPTNNQILSNFHAQVSLLPVSRQ